MRWFDARASAKRRKRFLATAANRAYVFFHEASSAPAHFDEDGAAAWPEQMFAPVFRPDTDRIL